jgi:hypothetical protein
MLLMLCLSCFATTKKLGHQVSLSLECKGLHSKMEYRRKPILPHYSIKFIQLPNLETDENVGVLFDYLINDQKHDKLGNRSFAYKTSRKHALLLELESANVYAGLERKDGTVGGGRIAFSPPDQTTYITCPEGLTPKSLVMDEPVFESADKIKIVVGPRQTIDENFKLATSVDDLNLSADFLARAGIVAGGAGCQKDLELIVVGAPGISEAAIRKKVDAIVQGPDYTAAVQSSAPQEANVAMMGGVGMSAAYHYHTCNFIFTTRAGLDHTWGKFCQTAPKGTSTENNPSLGHGVSIGAGADYKWTAKTAMGLEAGMRFNQLMIPLVKNQAQKSSMWFSTPYAQANCTFFGEDDTSLGLFSGYIFAKEFTVTSTGTCIPYGSPCKIGGLYGGLRLSKYF